MKLSTQGLTEQEAKVMDLLVLEGLTNQEIAKELGLTVRTAKFHVGNVLQKMGTPDRLKLAVLYWRGRSGEKGKPKKKVAARRSTKSRSRS
jgi:DNA-binding NarL/FixJ family response regulator